jgi:hypothetical protein
MRLALRGLGTVQHRPVKQTKELTMSTLSLTTQRILALTCAVALTIVTFPGFMYGTVGF